jgi:hypothetical protein
VTFVSTCFAQALLQSYLDHIRFHIVNWVALRHDAFSDAKDCPSFPAIPRPLFVASMMRRRETTSATARSASVGKLACVIADRGAKFDHMTFCRRTACRVGARYRGRPLYTALMRGFPATVTGLGRAAASRLAQRVPADRVVALGCGISILTFAVCIGHRHPLRLACG